MKTVLLSCAVLSFTLSFAAAAPPANAAKKGGKIEKPDARALITKNDADGDKKLDVTELHNALRSLKYNTVSTKNDSWKKFDQNADQKLDERELEKLLEANVPPPEEPAKPTDPKGKPPAKEGGLTLRPPTS